MGGTGAGGGRAAARGSRRGAPGAAAAGGGTGGGVGGERAGLVRGGPGAAEAARERAFPAVRRGVGRDGHAARQDEARRYHRVDRERGPGDAGRRRRPHGPGRQAAGAVREDGDQAAGHARRAGPRRRRGLLSRGGGAGTPGHVPRGRAAPAAVAELPRKGGPRLRPRRGRGRRETRSHLVMDAPEEIKARFPHASQVARVIRTRTVTSWRSNGKKRTRTTETHTETVYLITSLTAREAGPEHIAAYIRGHWGIENKVHLVRDVTLREDASKVRADSRPRALATLRNLIMGLIRQVGHDDIAATIRKAEYDNVLLLALLRITPLL